MTGLILPVPQIKNQRPTAFLTGGRRGIGKAISEKLKTEGFEVFCPTREELDLSKPEKVETYLKGCPVIPSVLINNAGENFPGLIETYAFADWLNILNVNLNSAFVLIKHFAPLMAKVEFGRILNISSCFSVKTRSGRAAYSASKAGVNGLTRTAAVEFAGKNVLVNSLSPGYVDTELTRQNNSPDQISRIIENIPMRRLAKPEEIAELAHFLVSTKNTYITGQNILIDGGFLIT